jgi:hypothetical protein
MFFWLSAKYDVKTSLSWRKPAVAQVKKKKFERINSCSEKYLYNINVVLFNRGG